MDGLVDGIYQICSDFQPVLAAVLVLMLIILGLTTVINGSDAQSRFKETIKWIVIGAAIGFGAMSLGKMIMGWFVI